MRIIKETDSVHILLLTLVCSENIKSANIKYCVLSVRSVNAYIVQAKLHMHRITKTKHFYSYSVRNIAKRREAEMNTAQR